MAEAPDPFGVATLPAGGAAGSTGSVRQALRRLWRPTSQRSLAFHLTLLCAALLAPVLLLSAGLSYAYVDAQRDAMRDSALQRAEGILQSLQQEIDGRIDMLRVLSATPALQGSDMGRFGDLARQAGELMNGEVTVRDPEGVLLAGRTGLVADPVSDAAVRQSRAPALSGLLQTKQGGYALRLTVPVLRNGTLTRLVSLTMDPQPLQQRLIEARLPEGWIAVVTDDRRHIILRSEANEDMLGRLISEEAHRVTGSDRGFWRSRNLDGEQVVVAHLRSASSGWRVGVMVPTRIVEAPLRRSLLLFAISSALLAALALALAILFAHRIAEPIQAMARAARRLGRGETIPALDSPIRELAAVNEALAEAGGNLDRRTRDLAESEARLARAVGAARMATWEWDRESDTLTGSKGREALYNAPEATLNSRAMLVEAIMPEDRGMVRAALAAALDPDGPGLYEVQFRVDGPGGEERWLQSQGAVVQRDQHGKALRMSGIVMDVTQAQHAAERERQLAKEVDHRARNVLTVVQSILRMSRNDNPAAFLDAVKGRIGVLARAHTLLSRSRWNGAELQELAADALEAYTDAGRVTASGPPAMLTMQSVQPLAQVLHEIVTNARQHGALSAPGGQASLLWQREDSGLILTWRERGGPTVRAPGKPGFGLRVMENTVRWQLAGTVETSWEEAGLTCTLRLPEQVLRRQIIPWQAEAPPGPAAPAMPDAAAPERSETVQPMAVPAPGAAPLRRRLGGRG